MKFDKRRKYFILKSKLKKDYLKKKLSMSELSQKYKCSRGTIQFWLKKYAIKIRTLSKANKISVIKSTKMRKKPRKLKIPSKEKLIKLYIQKKLSTWKIEKRYNYSRGTIHRKLKEYGIKIRSPVESHIIYSRKSFDGNANDKSYLIGFRIGDLRVRKTGETIRIDCASTKEAQIELIKELFLKYGRVWISKPRKKWEGYCWNIEALLNESFEFLLPKYLPKWIFKRKENFLYFLSGFTDAEGHIGIHNSQVVYSLENYNKKLLRSIKENIQKYLKIKSYLSVTDMSKYKRKDSYIVNKDYWQLRIQRKKHLIILFNAIESFMKHKDKLKDIKKVRANIKERNEKFGYRNM